MTPREFKHAIARLAEQDLAKVLICPQGPTIEQVTAAYAKYYGSWAEYEKRIQATLGDNHGRGI